VRNAKAAKTKTKDVSKQDAVAKALAAMAVMDASAAPKKEEVKEKKEEKKEPKSKVKKGFKDDAEDEEDGSNEENGFKKDNGASKDNGKTKDKKFQKNGQQDGRDGQQQKADVQDKPAPAHIQAEDEAKHTEPPAVVPAVVKEPAAVVKPVEVAPSMAAAPAVVHEPVQPTTGSTISVQDAFASFDDPVVHAAVKEPAPEVPHVAPPAPAPAAVAEEQAAPNLAAAPAVVDEPIQPTTSSRNSLADAFASLSDLNVQPARKDRREQPPPQIFQSKSSADDIDKFLRDSRPRKAPQVKLNVPVEEEDDDEEFTLGGNVTRQSQALKAARDVAKAEGDYDDDMTGSGARAPVVAARSENDLGKYEDDWEAGDDLDEDAEEAMLGDISEDTPESEEAAGLIIKDADDDMRQGARTSAKMLDSFKLEVGSVTGTVGIGLKDVKVKLGGNDVLKDVSWYIKTGDRVGMVGSNGCGKTTQIKILTGEIAADEGYPLLSDPEIKISTLDQSFVEGLNPENTLWEELLSMVPKEAECLREMQELDEEEKAVGQGNLPPDRLQRLIELNDIADSLKVYELEPRLAQIVKRIGFSDSDLDTEVGVFSGGWKVRIGLAKIFMTAPDALLLDEPTNHLDLDSVEWLERFLMVQTVPMVIISHDREFMDQVCNKMIECIGGKTWTYNCTYSPFVSQRIEKWDKWWVVYKTQENRLYAMQKWCNRSKTKMALANARKRKEALIEATRASPDYIQRPPQRPRNLKFQFPSPPEEIRGRRNGGILCEMRAVSHGYGEGADSVLFEDATLIVGSSCKMGIVGANGCGKSTLLRLLMGSERPNSGHIKCVDPETTLYFSQHQADLLPKGKKVIEVLKEANIVGMEDKDIKLLCDNFRFDSWKKYKLTDVLSGGEKARVAILCMMLQPSKLLIFDEPTNHMDIDIKECLEYALRNYPGGIIVVSHDRFFLSQVCTQICSIEDKKFTVHNGDYKSFIASSPAMKKKILLRCTVDNDGIGERPNAELLDKVERIAYGTRDTATKRVLMEKREKDAYFGAINGYSANKAMFSAARKKFRPGSTLNKT